MEDLYQPIQFLTLLQSLGLSADSGTAVHFATHNRNWSSDTD